MPKKRALTSEQREFFRLVAEAAFSNPFTKEREELDERISGKPGLSRREQIDATTARVRAHIAELGLHDDATLSGYPAEDTRILQSAFLFDAFHQFLEAFDELIRKQLQAGATPCPVPFARDALGLLRQRGFSEKGAERYFAMFYQLRRAFYFVDRALIGQSPCMGELRRRLWNNVFTSDIAWYDRYLRHRMEDFSTLLLGETGTGKGTAAAAIGRSGLIPFDGRTNRFACSFTETFISLNLSQFPETLLESELFGHRKGAFTGAVEHHEGVLARCSQHGAIFLDEIGEVGIPVQIKLLQVLQERTFCPVGSHDQARFEGRVIAATNRPLDALRSSGQFRDDFYYRLCSDIITMPPLRDRIREEPAELSLLLDQILHRLTDERAPGLRDEVQATLRRAVGSDYDWPGNVRELEQATRRILLTREYDRTTPAATDRTDRFVQALRQGQLRADEILGGYCRLLYERHGTYEEVARYTGLDRRTAKKHVEAGTNTLA